MTLFAYKMSRDFGFAPNPFGIACTLATCKPRIRKSAEIGDLIVACGSARNRLAGRIICMMRVSGKFSYDEYWRAERFQDKRPFFGGSRRRAHGDNIYHHDEAGQWMQERSQHTFPDGSINAINLRQDTSSDQVLWGDEFVYWGGAALPIPPEFRNFGGEDLYPVDVRDYRRQFSPEFVAKVGEWFEGLPKGRFGRPGAWEA